MTDNEERRREKLTTSVVLAVFPDGSYIAALVSYLVSSEKLLLARTSAVARDGDRFCRNAEMFSIGKRWRSYASSQDSLSLSLSYLMLFLALLYIYDMARHGPSMQQRGLPAIVMARACALTSEFYCYEHN